MSWSLRGGSCLCLLSRGQYKILIADLREIEGGLEEIIRTKEALELLVEDGENEATQQVDKKPQLEQVKNLMTRLICSKKLLLKMILKVSYTQDDDEVCPDTAGGGGCEGF